MNELEECNEVANEKYLSEDFSKTPPFNKVLLVGATLMLMSGSASAAKNNSLKKSKINFTTCQDFHIEEYIEKAKNIDCESEFLVDCFPNFKKDLRKKMTQDILSFKSFDKSWNGYGAIPAEIKSASNVIKLIFELSDLELNKVNDYYPNPHGTISVVFKNESKDIIEIEVGNEQYSFYASFCGLETEYINDVPTENFRNSYLFKLISFL